MSRKHTFKAHIPPSGFTPNEVARRYRVSPDKVRAWIKKRELAAINVATSLLAKPRYLVTPEALADFERLRAAGPAPTPPKRRKKTAAVDFYPD